MAKRKGARRKRKPDASSGQSADSLPSDSHTTSSRSQHVESGGGANFFPGANGVNINGSTLNTTVNIQQKYEYLRLLDAQVAPNAIRNAGGRADIPSCYPGTREEVISMAEDWMASGHRADRRVFWLSGPAGAGKSAIVQTLAERCIERNMLIATFFFFRADGSRNHSSPVVATLLHQLLPKVPNLKPRVNDIISENTLVFKSSIRDQLKILIDGPIRALRSSGLASTLPIVIMIDGLDECDPRPELDTPAKEEQRTLLRVLHELVTSSDSQFIALVASRVEPHIQMVFNTIGRTPRSIFLDDDYHPDDDIRLYITAELSRIRGTHPLGSYLPTSWPFIRVIDTIVSKSSGQFIFAATVSRFIENSPESPKFVMDMVMNLRPADTHSPFAEIDAIYMLILTRCKHSIHVCDILALHDSHRSGKVRMDAYIGYQELGYSDDEVISYFSDVTSIMKTTISDTLDIRFYHASFLDFINSPKRAGQFYADRIGSANRLAPRIIASYRLWDYGDARNVTRSVDQRSEPLTCALRDLLADPELPSYTDNEWRRWRNINKMVDRLYAGHDDELCLQVKNQLPMQRGDELDDWYSSEGEGD